MALHSIDTHVDCRQLSLHAIVGYVDKLNADKSTSVISVYRHSIYHCYMTEE